MSQSWEIRQYTADEETQACELAARLGLFPAMGRLLVARGIRTYEEAQSFFSPRLEELHDPFAMEDMQVAVERLNRAIEQRGRQLLALALEALCEEGFTLRDSFALTSTKCCLNLDLRISGRHEAKPSGLGLYHLTRQDLDLISIGEAVGEGEHLVIDLRPDTGVSEIGVDSIGEVQDRGVKW